MSRPLGQPIPSAICNSDFIHRTTNPTASPRGASAAGRLLRPNLKPLWASGRTVPCLAHKNDDEHVLSPLLPRSPYAPRSQPARAFALPADSETAVPSRLPSLRTGGSASNHVTTKVPQRVRIPIPVHNSDPESNQVAGRKPIPGGGIGDAMHDGYRNRNHKKDQGQMFTPRPGSLPRSSKMNRCMQPVGTQERRQHLRSSTSILRAKMHSSRNASTGRCCSGF